MLLLAFPKTLISHITLILVGVVVGCVAVGGRTHQIYFILILTLYDFLAIVTFRRIAFL